jgi:hypothetical protein
MPRARLRHPREIPRSSLQVVWVERAREEIAGCDAAERPPRLREGEDLFNAWKAVELVRVAEAFPDVLA